MFTHEVKVAATAAVTVLIAEMVKRLTVETSIVQCEAEGGERKLKWKRKIKNWKCNA